MSRDLKVADFIRDEAARIMQHELRDPRVGSFVSVNDVKVSRDLSYADIYVSSLQVNDAAEQAELIKVLNGAAGFFRSAIAKRHNMRTTPKPRFHYDELVQSGPRLEKLIDTAMQQNARNDDADTADADSPAERAGDIG